MTRISVPRPHRTLGAALVLACLCLARLLPGASSSGAAGPSRDGADGLSRRAGPTGLAQEPLAAPDGLALVGRPGGYVGAAIADGNFALASFDHRLYRYDLSDPRQPRSVASGPFVGDNAGLLLGNLSRLIEVDGPPNQGQAGSLQVGLVDWDRESLVGDTSQLQLVLLRDLSVIGQLELPGLTTAPYRSLALVTELAAAGEDHVLVAETEPDGQHVRIVDISRPEQPRLVGDYRPSGPVAGLAARGSLAYVLVHPARLVVLDLATPASPRPLADLPAVGGAMDLVLAGERAFVVGCNGLVVFDLADPALPRQLGPILPLVDPPAPSGGGPTPVPSPGGTMGCWESANLQWKDGRLYFLTAVDSFVPFQYSHVLWTIDVSRPEAPRIISQHGGAGEASRVAVGEGFAVLGNAHHGLSIVDLADPDQPKEAGILASGSMVQGPVAAEPNLMVQSLSDGWAAELRFIEPRPPWRGSAAAGQPASLGRLLLPESYLAEDLALEDGMAYAVIRGKGLLVVDARDPRAPLRTALLPQRALGKAVAVRRGVAYVAEADEKGAAGFLRVIDARDPATPVETATFPGTVKDLAVWGDLLVAAVADPPTLTLFDLRDPAHPAQVGSLPLAGSAFKIAAQDGRIYLLMGGAVVVVDSSDPAAPRLRGRLDLREGKVFPFGAPQDLVARGAVVYLGNYSNVQTIDASDPDAPRRVDVRIINSFIDLLTGPTEEWMPSGGYLAAAGHMVHLAGDKTGLWSFGAGTPEGMTETFEGLYWANFEHSRFVPAYALDDAGCPPDAAWWYLVAGDEFRERYDRIYPEARGVPPRGATGYVWARFEGGVSAPSATGFTWGLARGMRAGHVLDMWPVPGCAFAPKPQEEGKTSRLFVPTVSRP